MPTDDRTSNARPMMKCGCAAQGHITAIKGVKLAEPKPACLIHDCCEIAESAPSLEGRKARCTYYGGRASPRGSYGGGNECNYGQSNAAVCTCEQPSNRELPFFEFCGEGSRESRVCKHCGYAEVAHTENRVKCRRYEPKGDRGFDRFYCGCHGWD